MNSRLHSALAETQADYTCPVIPPLHSVDWRGFLALPPLPSPPAAITQRCALLPDYTPRRTVLTLAGRREPQICKLQVCV
jgi:hypothetical protein